MFHLVSRPRFSRSRNPLKPFLRWRNIQHHIELQDGRQYGCRIISIQISSSIIVMEWYIWCHYLGFWDQGFHTPLKLFSRGKIIQHHSEIQYGPQYGCHINLYIITFFKIVLEWWIWCHYLGLGVKGQGSIETVLMEKIHSIRDNSKMTASMVAASI